MLALLGNNGAGKTSLLQVCEGFRRPDGGRVRVLGLDPIADHDALMPRLGIMLQSGGVYPWATAGEILRLFASFSAHPLSTGMLLDRLGLRKVERTRFRRLSGGEQQRLCLAVALVGRPELVFLDEPTAGMDTEARHTTWHLIEELRADGVIGPAHHAPAGRGRASRRRRRDHALGGGRGHRHAGRAHRGGRHRPAGGARAARPADGGQPPPQDDRGPARGSTRSPAPSTRPRSPRCWPGSRPHDAQVTAVNTRRRTLEDVYLALTAQGASR